MERGFIKEVERLLSEYFKNDEKARNLAIKLFRAFHEGGLSALKEEVKKLIKECEGG